MFWVWPALDFPDFPNVGFSDWEEMLLLASFVIGFPEKPEGLVIPHAGVSYLHMDYWATF